VQQVSSSVCTPNKTDVYSLPSLIRSLESLKGNINTLYSLNVLYKELKKKIMEAKLKEAMKIVTIEMLNGLTYGEEIELNNKYCLYHYCEDDFIVLNDSEEWEELFVLQWDNETKEIIFEKC